MSKSLIILILIYVFGFLFIIRLFMKNKKRNQERLDMINSLQKGMKVITIGGLHGTIEEVKELVVGLKVDKNTSVIFNKAAIAKVVDQEVTENK